LETCCGYGYAQEWFSDTRPGLTLLPPGPATSAFHGPAVFPCFVWVGPPICCGVLPDFEPYLGLIPFQGPLAFFVFEVQGLLFPLFHLTIEGFFIQDPLRYNEISG